LFLDWPRLRGVPQSQSVEFAGYELFPKNVAAIAGKGERTFTGSVPFLSRSQIPQPNLSRGATKSTEQIFYEADRANLTITCGMKRVLP